MLYRRSAPTYKPDKWSYGFAADHQDDAGSSESDPRGWVDTSFMTSMSYHVGATRISTVLEVSAEDMCLGPRSLREMDEKMASGAELDFLPDERVGEREEGLIGLHPLCETLFDAFAEQMLKHHGSMGAKAVQDFAKQYAGTDGLFVIVEKDSGRVIEWRWIKKVDEITDEGDCQADN